MEQRGFVFHTENLLSPADAVATFLARVRVAPVGVESVEIDDAAGRVLAQDVFADRDYPEAPRSAMDGFAVRSDDAPGTLRIAGDIAMGLPWPSLLQPHTALRIPTGGIVPDGADAVVPVEETRLAGGDVVVGDIAPGEHINARGGDMRAGESVLTAGTVLRGGHLGALATLGISAVPVYRRPTVAVISSGDELVPLTAVPQPGQIRDSNRHAVAGTLQALGALPVLFATVSDAPGALEHALRAALERCDAVVLTGGSSVGERDRTPDALARLGQPGVIVHGLRVKPGKPTVLAAIGSKPIIGLPGNPASALTILCAVVAPIFERLAGSIREGGAMSAVLGSSITTRAGWTWFVPVVLKDEAGRQTAHPLPLRSSATSLLARATGYVLVGEALETIDAGTHVDVHRLL